MALIENMMYLLTSLFTTTTSFAQEKPLYNKEFLDKFDSPSDKKLLSETVKELKETKNKAPKSIKLSKGEVTIVVN